MAKFPVYNLDGSVASEVDLPYVFFTPFRPDLIHRAYVALSSHSIQPQGRDPFAGKKTSASTYNPPTGHGISRVPFVNGCRDLGEALRRISEGASMLRTKGEAGTGNVAEAVKHMKLVVGKIRELRGLSEEQLFDVAKEYRVPIDLVKETAKLGRLPVVNFAAGGIATPADAALMMHLGADGVFVGSGIFKSKDPATRAEAIVIATTYWDDPKIVLEASKMISEEKSMIGIDIKTLKPEQMMQIRGV